MPDTHHPHYADGAIVNVETHREKSDVDARALMWFAVIFVIFAVVTHFALWILFRFFIRMERRQSTAPLTEMARPADMNVPAEPRLQPFPKKAPTGALLPPNMLTPATDMDQMRAAEDRALHSYGWVDQQKGIVHIPIEEAKEKLLQQPLPVVTQPARGAPASQPGAHP